MNSIIQDLSIAVGLLALLALALELGFRAGLRAASEKDSRMAGQVGAVQGALLGLLGLLLAFSFAAAGSRFLERQDLITQEANAIGTAYLRADLLDDPSKSQLQTALAQYTHHRLEVAEHFRTGVTAQDLAEVDSMHERMWAAAVQGVNAKPQCMVSVLPPVNDVIDIHSIRLAAGRKHVPAMVMGLLIACSALAVGVIGYGNGLGGHRRAALTMPLAILIGLSLWITIDLDHPRAGLMQLSDEPLKSLKFKAGQ